MSIFSMVKFFIAQIFINMPLLMGIFFYFSPAVVRADDKIAELVIASKLDTESQLLGDILTGLSRSAGVPATHKRGLGASRIVWQALLAGDIDAYVDYTGTLSLLLLGDATPADLTSIRARLEAMGLRVSAPLGFENSYAIGLRAGQDSAHKAKGQQDQLPDNLSELAHYKDLRLGFSHQFMERSDGWAGLKARYGLSQQPQALAHELAYEAIAAGQLDATDVYTTDPEILLYNMKILVDDRGYFPDYAGLVVYRADLMERAPQAAKAFEGLAGAISLSHMQAMNKAVKIERLSSETVANEFIAAHTGQAALLRAESYSALILRVSFEHIRLVFISLLAAFLCAFPLGIWAARSKRVAHIILPLTGLLQTIPSLALFVFMIPFLGIGAAPAIAALFLYSLLPIVRNVHAGLKNLDGDMITAGLALGLPDWARLRLIELPLALPVIVAGVKTAAVINVGTATLGALIGAGGYGEPILTGIRLSDMRLILAGAVPAALMALCVEAALTRLEYYLTKRQSRKK